MNRERVHHIIYTGCLCLLAISIPLSNFLLSLGGIFIALNWFLEWNWKEKWENLKRNRSAFVLSIFFLLCLLTLLQTDNTSAGLSNILNKLPLFYTPLIMASSRPLSGGEQRLVLNSFLAGTLIGTFVSSVYYCTHDIRDIREISVFISHIRFSLCIIWAMCLSVFFISEVKVYPKKARNLYTVVLLWLLTYLFIAQTITGIFIFLCLIFFLFIYLFMKRKYIPYRKWIIGGTIGLMALLALYSFHILYDYYHVNKKELVTLEEKTANGNPYFHDTESIIENGSYIGLYISHEELRSEWSSRSDIAYDSALESTLIRYLNSKKLRKDAEGVKALSDKDIWNIENGIANVEYTRGFGIKRSLYPILFSFSLYHKYGKTDYSTILERVELWKTSLNVIRNHFWTGVGAGDHKAALDAQLTAQHSSITYKKEMGCHNQFLTYGLMGGIWLVVYFIFTLIYPFLNNRHSRHLLYILFFIIIFVSLFTEDTLETQVGVTLYAFFNSFLLFIFDKNRIKKQPLLKIKTHKSKSQQL